MHTEKFASSCEDVISRDILKMTRIGLWRLGAVLYDQPALADLHATRRMLLRQQSSINEIVNWRINITFLTQPDNGSCLSVEF